MVRASGIMYKDRFIEHAFVNNQNSIEEQAEQLYHILITMCETLESAEVKIYKELVRNEGIKCEDLMSKIINILISKRLPDGWPNL